MADTQPLLSTSAIILEDVRMYMLVIMAVVVALLSENESSGAVM